MKRVDLDDSVMMCAMAGIKDLNRPVDQIQRVEFVRALIAELRAARKVVDAAYAIDHHTTNAGQWLRQKLNQYDALFEKETP